MRGSLFLRTLGMLVMATAFAVSSARAQAQTPGGAEGSATATRQPQWTARPLFSETGVYVLPKGVTAFIFDLRPTMAAHAPTVTDSAYHVEFGLPARFQLGLHATGRTNGGDGRIGNIDAQALEVRWAFADWGRAVGNPTIQAGWTEASRGADVGEVKLLLGGGIGPAWRWGSNLAWTQQASGAREAARAWTAGISYQTSRFASVGAETRLAFTDRSAVDGSRSEMARELLAGPSIQLRPLRRLHVDLAALFGASAVGTRSRIALLAGWEFQGPASETRD